MNKRKFLLSLALSLTFVFSSVLYAQASTVVEFTNQVETVESAHEHSVEVPTCGSCGGPTRYVVNMLIWEWDGWEYFSYYYTGYWCNSCGIN